MVVIIIVIALPRSLKACGVGRTSLFACCDRALLACLLLRLPLLEEVLRHESDLALCRNGSVRRVLALK